MSYEVDKNAKTRLKWTRELHQQFVDAVSRLGGVERATPKSVMGVMGIPGITLYHLKSHLQKYRLAKNRDHKVGNDMEDFMPKKDVLLNVSENGTRPRIYNSRTMLQLQMEVQRKLQEQIEVQKHLQVRIEAQGKYLQSVLKKAQETISLYSLNSMIVESSKAEISGLISSVNNKCPCSSISNQFLNADCSTDSCVTSEVKNWKQQNLESSDCSNTWSGESNEIEIELEQSVGVSEEIDLNR